MTEKLPTGTVTLLMARVEGSERLWQTEPDETAAALPWLRASMTHLTALNDGALRAGHDACDSFVATFGRASDAVACALDLQLAPLEPFALCIGLHTVEYTDLAGTDGAARLRDLAHGGQTLVSGTTAALAANRLPAYATLKPLGSHPLGDRQWHEPLFQLGHPGLRNHVELLRAPSVVGAHHLSN
ncbi:LuxR family transcriptional regulator [Mycolicibacterium mageritense DSM 44476 = CIP 104973]|uniref:LuxR family transcriptional regulator n=1 Tax=Mycolicibacterium mageritense TaxID=53462 RepID=A0ABM7HQJ1_MYCME|nr:adenylate/guanylate cyclase domain-containing protein [Mycolicibacterium mageritense]MCC9183608.1 adenylate/guanylate cyclase domain-containing protein [Mycolicibacterium mageritense]TXI61765.1 MAG: adenylate/guanylate cyclase domain-containing protein [Mycolicibacterium mageritense]BBX32792.1 LuxR family transcriptional regulator [Mycolicibacterium mageritense]CDO22670.1 LuxR family transcriptional regulator [Mycolicibacterium mageritense DSM 44476 = CIP 104973]